MDAPVRRPIDRPTFLRRLSPGFIAFALHRLTGVLLGIYLFVHIWVVHHLSHGEAAFNDIMAVVQSPLFHVLEIGLLGAVLFHALNGVRVVFVEFGRLVAREVMGRTIFATLVLVAVLTLVGAVPFLRLAFGH